MCWSVSTAALLLWSLLQPSQHASSGALGTLPIVCSSTRRFRPHLGPPLASSLSNFCMQTAIPFGRKSEWSSLALNGHIGT